MANGANSIQNELRTELEDYIGYAASRLSGDMSAYTEDSVKAVQSAYDEAVKVNENSQIQAEINEALANLKSAMSGLKTYKKALQEKVDEVKAVDTAEKDIENGRFFKNIKKQPHSIKRCQHCDIVVAIHCISITNTCSRRNCKSCEEVTFICT